MKPYYIAIRRLKKVYKEVRCEEQCGKHYRQRGTEGGLKGVMKSR
jgi:hypothetical protein